MTDKQKIIIAALAIAGAFVAGRYSDTVDTKTTIHAVTKTNVEDDTQKDKNTHETTKTITKKARDGSVTTVTTTDTVTELKSKEDKDTQIVKTLDKTVETKSGSKLNVSLLASYDITNPKVPSLGLSVSKEVLGPVTAGIFGYQNGVVGVSIGLDF